MRISGHKLGHRRATYKTLRLLAPMQPNLRLAEQMEQMRQTSPLALWSLMKDKSSSYRTRQKLLHQGSDVVSLQMTGNIDLVGCTGFLRRVTLLAIIQHLPMATAAVPPPRKRNSLEHGLQRSCVSEQDQNLAYQIDGDQSPLGTSVIGIRWWQRYHSAVAT
jgi:hypothetical protein